MMLRLTNRRMLLFINIFASLLLWILGATIYYGSFCDASMWSYMTGSSDTIVEDEKPHITDTEMNIELVSPIVNREIKVSVEAPWPSSSEHSILCEAFMFLKGDHSFLDALASSHGRDHLVTFERSTEYALELAAGLGFGDDLSLNPKIRLLKVALAMRAMAPACELHRSIAHSRYPNHVDFLKTFGVVTFKTKANDGTTEDFILETSASLPKSVEDMPRMTKAQRNAFLLPDEVIREGSKTIVVNKNDDQSDDGDDESEMTTSVVVLYTQLGGISFTTFYRKLVENKIPFVVRHMGSVDDDRAESLLQGYGVRVDIRNVEYKVFDDKKKSDDIATEDAMINLTSLGTQSDFNTNNSTGVDDSVEGICDASTSSCSPEDTQTRNHLTTHFLAGINVTALDLSSDGNGKDSSAEEKQRELWKLHNRFEQHKQLIPPTWQRRHLSIQAATAVAGSRDPLIALQDVSQNLPSMASTLVHVTVPEDIKTFAESMEASLQRLIKTSGGGLWINGRSVDIERPSFNVFELIQMLQDEFEELEELESQLKPVLSSGNSMKALEQIRDAFTRLNSFFSENDNTDADDIDEGENSSPESLFRIDLATGEKDSVIYMNDLEKDKSYAHVNPSVRNMIMSMQYGMPPSVRRNLFTVLVVVDPLQHDRKNIGQGLIGQLVQQEFPARLAMVVVSQEDVDACSKLISAGKGCPVSADYWLNEDHPPTVDELRKTKATTRDMHRLYAYMRQKFASKSQALVMYQMYLPVSLQQNPPSNGEFYSLFDVFNAHNEMLGALGIADIDDPFEDIAEALQLNEEDSMQSYGKAVMFAVNKGITPGMSFINGRPLPMKEDEAEKVQKIFNEEQSLVFGMIMNEEITDTKPRNFYYKLIKGNKKNIYPRLHPLLTGDTSENSFLDISHNFGAESLLMPRSMQSGITALDSDAIFIYEAFLALDTPKGLNFALNFLNAMDNIPLSVGNANITVKYRIIPSTLNGANTDICKVLNSAGKLGFEKTRDLLERLLKNSDVAINEYTDTADLSSCHDLPYLQEELPSKNFITANGRLYSIDETSLSNVDIELLIIMGLHSSKKVSEILKPHLNEAVICDAVGRTSAFLSAKALGGRKRSGPNSFVASMETKADVDENPFRFLWNEEAKDGEGLRTKVVAIVDPTTETAQRLSPLLLVIRDELRLPLELILAPRTELDGESDIPISSYYRFVADPSAYQAGRDSTSSPNARFSNLPTDHILTLRMDVPEPWDVQQTRAIQDTDNLRCDLQSGCGDEPQTGVEKHRQTHVTNVAYELQHLLVSGQCYETDNLSPPNGLQLVLSEQNVTSNPEAASNTVSANIEADGSIRMENDNFDSLGKGHYSDTLVMKTVGYWQLRANPGIWDLKINDDSRGADIFQMVAGQIKHGSARVTNPIANNKKQLVVRDFIGRHKGELLMVKRKQGYERATLFYEDEKKASQNDDDVVHVFSLATGHLYERFLKIMMLSVTKRTSTKVKFWLFENFLSPTFKASSIAMANKIGCEVEFVTYKWPEWLRGQSEKQRIIWGYKILFLDVLFPLNVKKIIYVDADQVIRGDLKELRDMDLQGAPYGYTPMCSSNEATLGFQFWNQGFCKYRLQYEWMDECIIILDFLLILSNLIFCLVCVGKSHLRGKPYHISALYVVDLEKFRKDRVGDILRSQYQQLSADPGSLANLDQDLPNYVQHQVPIFSLPQEWLWCESWCSNETKADSKTIDLCNNPLHKEPKVSMAKRIISGDLFVESWIELDTEVEKYENEYKSESLIEV